jgi:hypothetical protein
MIVPEAGRKRRRPVALNKRRILRAAIFILCLLAGSAAIAIAVIAVLPGPVPAESPFPSAFAIALDPALQLGQTYNNCGPYSVRAVIAVLTGVVLDCEKLAAFTHRITGSSGDPPGRSQKGPALRDRDWLRG